ncbi:MAG TPA: prenyltransferase [Dehalococcoidia bacterium]|nr:prenyltransferase [Dehalococcoidia bacterium]
MKLKTLFLETRPQFLLLSIVLAFLGTAIAWHSGDFHLGYAVLAFAGLLLAHVAVNVLNDYFDYHSGIDLETKRTPFSGGSGVLPAAMLSPGQVLWFGLITFVLTIPVGIYFVIVAGWPLLPLILVGGACILLYTPVLSKLGWPEWAAGAGLGTLPVLGAYFVQTSSYPLAAVIAAVPSGIMVHNLLFLNEFPDVEADIRGGRRTLPILIGKIKASYLYAAMTTAIYAWIIAAVAWGIMPAFCLLSLLTLPLAYKAVMGSLKFDDESKLMPAMGSNVMVILFTQLLLGIGYILAEIF